MLYKIIEGYNADQMGDYIQPLLDDGWTLHGNLVAHIDERSVELGSRRTVYAQTLIKEETPEELDARVNYFEILLAKPLDQLTPEERKDREDYLEAMEDEQSEQDADA